MRGAANKILFLFVHLCCKLNMANQLRLAIYVYFSSIFLATRRPMSLFGVFHMQSDCHIRPDHISCRLSP